MPAEGPFWIQDDNTPEWAERVVRCIDVSSSGYSEYEIFLPKPPVSAALLVESNEQYTEGTPLFRHYFEAYHCMQWAIAKELISGHLPPMESFEMWVENVSLILRVVEEVPEELPDNVISITEGMDEDEERVSEDDDLEESGGEEEEPF